MGSLLSTWLIWMAMLIAELSIVRVFWNAYGLAQWLCDTV